MLDGPVQRVKCLACQSAVEIAPSNWKRILDFRTDEKVRKHVGTIVIGFASEFTFHTRLGPQAPKCTGCQTLLDVAGVAPGADTDLTCKCGVTMPTFPTPSWLRSVEPHAVQLFNVAREESGKGPVTAQANRPVSFGCPDCGANLKITSESPRVLECQYCKTDLFLPDALWRALHPVKKRGAWYVTFT
jgi:hypothetical protein